MEELNDKFGIAGEIGFYEEDDLVFTSVSNKYADALISLYGGQILSYNPVKNFEVLWMSPYSSFEKGNAIRGGIPVCFPWFGPHDSKDSFPQHGFARIQDWEVNSTKTLASGESQIVLQLNSSETTREFWPHDFCAELKFTVGKELIVSLNVKNTSELPLEYSCALHSYFSLSGIENVAIKGLQNTRYQNQLDGGDYLQETPLLQINKAETRHYYDTQGACVIYDPVFNRCIRVEKSGSANTTVWNPWADACSEMKDMPNNAYETFVCLETVNKINDRICLNAGESHETKAIISTEQLI